jgi:hypothetical protein
MRVQQFNKYWFGVFALLAIFLVLSGPGRASGENVEVRMNSHQTHQVYKPGDQVEMKGTAKGVSAVSILVESEQHELVFSARPLVENGAFAAGFALDPNATEGKYTIILGIPGQQELKRYKFSVTFDGSTGANVQKNVALTINGNGVEREVSFTRAELEAMTQEREKFSVVNDWPAKLFVAAAGVPLQVLLEQAGIKPEAQMITFKGSDGYRIDFTIDELLHEQRYYFPGLMSGSKADHKLIKPIIALQRVEEDDDFSKMSDRDTPVLCFGQRTLTEQILCEYVKRLKTITVTTDSPGQWDQPTAKIIDTETGKKLATSGGKIKSGSQIVLESDPKVKVHYTTDGSAPDLESEIYNVSFHVPTLNKPILVKKDITIKAKTVGFGKRDSEVVTFTFTVDGTQGLSPEKGSVFSDIQNSWAREDITLLEARGLIKGKSATTYEPLMNITRAEFAALLVRALGLEEGVLKEGQFTDAAPSNWYAGSVATAVAKNIIKGYDGNLFKPDKNITREEMAAMFARASLVGGMGEILSGGEQEEQLAQFKDRSQISSWAIKDVALAVKAGIINGMPGGEFLPQANADRAQSAAMLKRFLTYVNLIADH